MRLRCSRRSQPLETYIPARCSERLLFQIVILHRVPQRMDPLPAVPFTLDNTIGALLIGFAVSCLVFGILLTQSYVYFSRFPSDKWLYQLLVSDFPSSKVQLR